MFIRLVSFYHLHFTSFIIVKLKLSSTTRLLDSLTLLIFAVKDNKIVSNSNCSNIRNIENLSKAKKSSNFKKLT